MRGVQGQILVEQCFYQNVKCGIVKKTQDSSKKESSGLLSKLGIKTP